MKILKTKFLNLILLSILIITVFPLSSHSAMIRQEKAEKSIKRTSVQTQITNSDHVLPRKGDIAVIVEADKDYLRRAEAFIVDNLIKRGYRVVDEAKMKKIRAASARAQAARLALFGEESKILRISSHYSVAATVIANIISDQPKENEFGFYVGTASAAFLVIKSNGIRLGGKISESKKIASSEAEVRRQAVDDAMQKGIIQIF